MNNFDIDKLTRALLNSSGGKIKQSDIERLKKGDASALFGALSESDRNNLKKALSNGEYKNKVLNSEKAKNIMNNLKKGNGNG